MGIPGGGMSPGIWGGGNPAMAAIMDEGSMPGKGAGPSGVIGW